jgi:hypothetical protein
MSYKVTTKLSRYKKEDLVLIGRALSLSKNIKWIYYFKINPDHSSKIQNLTDKVSVYETKDFRFDP